MSYCFMSIEKIKIQEKMAKYHHNYCLVEGNADVIKAS